MLITVLPIGTDHSMRHAHLATRYIDTNTRRLAAVKSIAVAAQAIRSLAAPIIGERGTHPKAGSPVPDPEN